MLDYTKIPIERVREMWKKYPQGYPTVVVTPSLPPNKDAYGYIYETFIDDQESSLFGKYYIGQFVQHQLRGFKSGSTYFGSGAIISKYIKSRGTKYLKKKILEYADNQYELDLAEIKWITTIDKNPRSLNLKTGGRAGRLTEHSVNKISETLKNRWKTDTEFAEKMRESYKKRILPDQNGKPKLGLTDVGRKSLAEHAAKTHTGRKRSQETKDKISAGIRKHYEVKNEKILKVNQVLSKIFNDGDFYLVGGCVRDAVMGNEPKDYDICGPLLPEAVGSIIESLGMKTFNVNGLEFGTISFFIDVDGEKLPIEYTTFRSEVYTNKSRKPEVKFVPSLDEDLARRDFSMNSLVLRSDGSIYDKFGGRLDIHAKQIKTVGMPKERILEDPLRILRAARFAARYDFKIDPNFIGKARQLADRIFDVSVERWVAEMDKMLTSDHCGAGLEALASMGVLPRILPELYFGDGHEGYVNPFSAPNIKVYENADEAWKFLLDNIHAPDAVNEPTRTKRFVMAGLCARFKFSNERTEIILDKPKKKE